MTNRTVNAKLQDIFWIASSPDKPLLWASKKYPITICFAQGRIEEDAIAIDIDDSLKFLREILASLPHGYRLDFSDLTIRDTPRYLYDRKAVEKIIDLLGGPAREIIHPNFL